MSKSILIRGKKTIIITPKMSQQPCYSCHLSTTHTHAKVYDFAIASTNASTSTMPPLTFANVSGPTNKGISKTAHNYSYVSLNL